MNDYKRGGMCRCARPCRRAHRFLGGYIPCGRCRRLPCRSQRGDDLTVTVGVAVAPVPAVAGHRVPLVVVPVPDAVALGSRRRRPVPVVVRAVVRAAARRPGPGSAGEPEAEERLVVDLGGDLRHECEVRGVVGDDTHTATAKTKNQPSATKACSRSIEVPESSLIGTIKLQSEPP